MGMKKIYSDETKLYKKREKGWFRNESKHTRGLNEVYRGRGQHILGTGEAMQEGREIIQPVQGGYKESRKEDVLGMTENTQED